MGIALGLCVGALEGPSDAVTVDVTTDGTDDGLLLGSELIPLVGNWLGSKLGANEASFTKAADGDWLGTTEPTTYDAAVT